MQSKYNKYFLAINVFISPGFMFFMCLKSILYIFYFVFFFIVYFYVCNVSIDTCCFYVVCGWQQFLLDSFIRMCYVTLYDMYAYISWLYAKRAMHVCKIVCFFLFIYFIIVQYIYNFLFVRSLILCIALSVCCFCILCYIVVFIPSDIGIIFVASIQQMQ